jgi:acetyl esterase/lipase
MDQAHYFRTDVPAPDFTEVFASVDGQDLVADVFVPPEDRRNGAAVLLVHGGGWSAGERSAFLWHAHRLSAHGYVASTIDYRLSQVACYPAAVLDCRSAMRWLRRNAERFGVGPDRVGAMGSSAGGHLVACLGVMEAVEEGISAKANCVVDVHGVHDLVALSEGNEVKQSREAFLGGPIDERRETWIEASPALHVDADSAPTLLIHDPGDETVPYAQSLILARALMEAARPVRFLPSPGSGHGFVYNPQNAWTQRVWPVAVAWLDGHLLGISSAGLAAECEAG